MLNTFVITGRPGSGKSVQAKLLSEKTGYILFSPGERYRDIATQETAFGRKIKETIDNGLLGPSWLSTYLFQNTILNIDDTDGIIFEGVGRKEAEAKMFNETMEWLGRDYRVINLTAGEEVITTRLTLRHDIESRNDDDPEDIPVRITEYNTHTLPAIHFFGSVDKCIEINGEQDIEGVHNDIVKSLDL
ncbi:nucleoside monophosphate kinase [Candidatus Kaiserbacteria bacterium]|nr:nucleoside monophosphate kinase [Candidatus Kaiserbacteria bacterium]